MLNDTGNPNSFAQFVAKHRSVWFMKDDNKHFMGFWEVWQEFDDEKMVLRGLPDWPLDTPDRIEIHRIENQQPQDQYDLANLDLIFEKVLAIRPVRKEPTSRISDDPADPHRGRRVIFSFDETDPQLTSLTLTVPIATHLAED